MLTYFLWKKHESIDLSVYISFLFAFTSLCCILMVELGFLSSNGGVLYDGWEPDFEFLPTILYCGMITITILPFSLIRTEKIETINNVHRITLYAFTLLILIQGILMFYLVGEFMFELLNGDFKFLKDTHYAGNISPADAKMLTMPLPFQLLYLTSFMTLLGLPLFFYYSCIEKKSLWFTLPILIISISPILRGMLIADRTEIIHYGLMFFFCLVFFHKFITKKIRNFFIAASIPVLAIGLTYFIAVSASRFENEEGGTEGNLLEYAGQSYANFCYFYENHNPDLFYIERELPVTSFFLLKSQYVDTKEERTAKEGFFIGVFASHVGSWMLDTGIAGSISICILFALICCLIIKTYNRTVFDIADVLMIFSLGAIPTFGIFYYRYYTIATAFIYVAAGALYIFSKFIFTWQKDIEKTETA